MRRRGRPPEVDPRELSLVALRLFERDGYDAVTMTDIAAAASVSRRTLFRLFPSKADLVWAGLDEVLVSVRAHLADRAVPGASLDALVDEVFAPSLTQLDDPVLADVARRRLRLVASSPALFNHPTLEALQEVLTTLVAANRGPDDPPPALVAGALYAVAFSSVLWWARNEGTLTPLEALREALRALSRTARPTPLGPHSQR